MSDSPPHLAAPPRPDASADRKADERATLALVFGILGVAVFPPLGVAGIVFGRRARRGLSPDHPKQSMALVGLVLGWVGLALIAFFGAWLLLVLVIV